MDKKLNICIVSREFAPDTAFGGIATFSMDTALMLQSHGHKVTVLSQSLSGDSFTEINGIRLYKLRLPRLLSSYRFLALLILGFNWVVFRKLMQLHRQERFDLVDAPDHLAEGLFVSLHGKIPLVTRLHTPFSLIVHLRLNNYKKNFTYYCVKFLESVALHRSAAWYSPSKNLACLCNNFFGITRPTSFFGYPIDLEMFSPMNSASRVQADGIKILFLGRLEQRKGIETIADAFPILAKQMANLTLTLLGRDTPNIRGFSSAKEFLLNRFRAAGCENRVCFVDYVPLNELPAHICAHDILWAPSIYDNYPLVCIEAMACEKVVIAANSGGMPEFITDMQTGGLFSVGDAQSLVDKTLEICGDSVLMDRIGKSAREFVQDNYATEHIYEQTMRLYETAMNGFHEG